MPKISDFESKKGSLSVSNQSSQNGSGNQVGIEDNRSAGPAQMLKADSSNASVNEPDAQNSVELADESARSGRGEIRAYLNSLKPELLKGVTFEERKQEVEGLLSAENFTLKEIQVPEMLSRIELLAKGGVSKTTLLGDGLRMQFLDGAEAFKSYLLALHRQTGAISYGKDDGTEFLHLLAPLKGLARMGVKEQEKYKGIVSKIKDVARTSLMFHNIGQIIAADRKLRSMDQHRILETKDRFGILDPSIFNQADGSRQTKKGSVEMERDNLNYRDIIYIVEVDGILQDKPVKMEIQFHAEKMHDAKSDKGLAESFLPQSAALIDANKSVITEHYKEIGLTATSLAKYSESGFTGHDLYKIIRCFDLKKFKEDPAAQKAMEAAKELSREIYKSVEVPE